MTANANIESVSTANVNVYECMFLLDTNKVAGNTTELSNQVHAILEKHKAEILISRPWDDRKLAYTVKGQTWRLLNMTASLMKISFVSFSLKLTPSLLMSCFLWLVKTGLLHCRRFNKILRAKIISKKMIVVPVVVAVVAVVVAMIARINEYFQRTFVAAKLEF